MLGELGWPGMDAFFFACCLGNLENIKGWPLGDTWNGRLHPPASDLLKHIFARRFSTKWLILILYGYVNFRCFSWASKSRQHSVVGIRFVHPKSKVPQSTRRFQWFPPDIYRGEVEDLPHVGHGSNHSYLGPGLLVAINGDLFVGKRMGWGTPNFEHTQILTDWFVWWSSLFRLRPWPQMLWFQVIDLSISSIFFNACSFGLLATYRFTWTLQKWLWKFGRFFSL